MPTLGYHVLWATQVPSPAWAQPKTPAGTRARAVERTRVIKCMVDVQQMVGLLALDERR